MRQLEALHPEISSGKLTQVVRDIPA